MFCMILSSFLLFFVYFVPLVTEKVVLASESLFQPANDMRSTRLLVKIHNRFALKFVSLNLYLIRYSDQVMKPISDHQTSSLVSR